MKIELIKETKLNGDVFYFIEENGVYIRDSTTMDFAHALKLYDFYLTNGGTKKEVLKSTEL